MLAEQEEGGGPAPRILLSRAIPVAEQIAGALRDHPAADRVEIAGSVRRMGDTAKDIDIIATAERRRRADLDAGRAARWSSRSRRSGEAGARVVTHSGMKVDLRVVAPDQFGNVLQHFTGSKAHNVQLREAAGAARAARLRVRDPRRRRRARRCAARPRRRSTSGSATRGSRPSCARGAASSRRRAKGTLPELIELERPARRPALPHDALATGARRSSRWPRRRWRRGWEYLAVTDHSASHGFGDHVTPEALEARIEEVAALNERLDGITMLAGTESNILPDGSLDYPDELLQRLDWVIGSIHTSFGMDEAAMTERMVAAVEHPWLDAIGHPTGRKIETRPPYAIDMTRVIAAAAANGTMIEINSAPDRRDMNEIHARAAAEAGVMVLIDSDAHSAQELRAARSTASPPPGARG